MVWSKKRAIDTAVAVGFEILFKRLTSKGNTVVPDQTLVDVMDNMSMSVALTNGIIKPHAPFLLRCITSIY